MGCNLNIVIEVTRKCNLACDHCLRGCAQNTNIKLEYIDKLFEIITEKDVDNIDLTLTGGEPSLNLKALKHIRTKLKYYHINLSSFYLATNGINNNNKNFISILLEFYSLVDDKDMFRIDISDDVQHQYERGYAASFMDDELIHGLKGVDFRDKDKDYSYEGALKEGRAKENNFYGPENIVDTDINLDDTTFYLNCKGNIINGCDWSYESQERKELIISDVCSFNKVLDRLLEGSEV